MYVISVCDDCQEKGQRFHLPAMHACRTCVSFGALCLKASIFVYTADCEPGNKKAFEILTEEYVSKTLDPDLNLLVCLQMQFMLVKV